MTKQFKKDCVMLCKAFEETRVSRTVGRSDRAPKELPPLLSAAHHPPGCRCLRMMPNEMPQWHKMPVKAEGSSIWSRVWQRLLCTKTKKRRSESRRRAANTDPYTYQFSEIKNKKQTRASSISSENFCSSRSSSWRNGPPSAHTCAIPLKMMEPSGRRRHSAWLITRKTSQDSNLSSSRNDSSASATTASTSTFRLSRSSAGSTTPLPPITAHNNKTTSTTSKPRLVRQEAVQEEDDSSPPRLGVRFLPTIPSAADSSVALEEDSIQSNSGSVQNFYTVLEQQTGTTKAMISSPKYPANERPP